MESIETEGRNKEEAVQSALEKLGLREDQVTVELLEEGKRFLGLLGGGRVRVRVSYEPPVMVADAAKEVLMTLLDHMGIAAFVECLERQEEVRLNVVTSQGGLVIGKHGETIDALQYLVNRLVSKQVGALPMRIMVDSENYRAKHQERIRQLAQKAARQVKSSGKPATLAPMSSQDRRIIHLALQDDDEVVTVSDGEGAFRRIRILPKRADGSADD